MALPYTQWRFVVKPYTLLINQVFPSECVHCHQEGSWLCSACDQAAIQIHSPTCPLCHRLSPHGRTCARCRMTGGLNGARSIWHYDGPITSLVRRFKYEGITSSQDIVIPHFLKLLRELPLPTKEALVTSVPSTPQKLVERGFNQSEILAQALSAQANLPYQTFLTRADHGVSQTKLSRKERLANAATQYSLAKPVPANATIIVIDDVLTTGATLNSCALRLHEGGARHVWGLTIAKD